MCCSIWWLLQHRDGSTLAFLFVFVLGRRVRALFREFLSLDWPYILFTWSPHIYSIVVYVFRSADDVSLSLIPLVHVVDQEETRYGLASHKRRRSVQKEETGYGVGHRFSVSSPLPWGMGDAYAVCGASMCPWDMGGGWSPLGSSRPLFNDFRADTTL